MAGRRSYDEEGENIKYLQLLLGFSNILYMSIKKESVWVHDLNQCPVIYKDHMTRSFP